MRNWLLTDFFVLLPYFIIHNKVSLTTIKPANLKCGFIFFVKCLLVTKMYLIFAYVKQLKLIYYENKINLQRLGVRYRPRVVYIERHTTLEIYPSKLNYLKL